jgi:hypothetical protein
MRKKQPVRLAIFTGICTFQFVDRKLSVDWEKKTKVLVPVNDIHTQSARLIVLDAAAHSELWERALVIIICIFTPATSRMQRVQSQVIKDIIYGAPYNHMLDWLRVLIIPRANNKTIIIDGRESA